MAMRQLTNEQSEYAIGRLQSYMETRGVNQKELAARAKVDPSTVSRIFSRTLNDSGRPYSPGIEALTKLFQGLGLKLSDILAEPDCVPDKICGYLATPLTGLSAIEQRELSRVVAELRAVAGDASFRHAPFDIYWPGDYTHPITHANLSADKVYLTDRSRASTQDFIILLCAERSYGVGQENEIATQAGVPAVRLIPNEGSFSRMMAGSFLRTVDVTYAGSLETGVRLNQEKILTALREIRGMHFRHRALYRGLTNITFGARLKGLIDDRCGGNYLQVAEELGISLTYLLTLMNEPFEVSNPSARLLMRLGRRLGERVAYLLGESEDVDPIWLESNSSWEEWVSSGSGIDAKLACELRGKWQDEYHLLRREHQPSSASFRSKVKLMKVRDWDQEYQKIAKGSLGTGPIQGRIV